MSNVLVKSSQEALRPLKSLLGKSEKACQKLSPGTWQHTMLANNITALQVSSRLMNKEGTPAMEDLQVAVVALSDMRTRTEKALSKFEPGTSQHTLQRNRLNALQLAEALVKDAIERSNA